MSAATDLVVMDDALKAKLAEKIGPKASVLAASAAQLNFPEGAGWRKSPTKGACVLIVDRSKDHSPMLVQIWDTTTFDVRYEIELFAGMQYAEAQPFFHVFSTQTGEMYGLSFAADDESAHAFFRRVSSMIPKDESSEAKLKKKGSVSRFFSKMFGKDDDDEAKVQISKPSNFVHRSHIGFNPETGFNVEDIPDEWKAIFKEAGIKKKDLRNPETAALIYEVTRHEMKQMIPAAPPVPADAADFAAAAAKSNSSNNNSSSSSGGDNDKNNGKNKSNTNNQNSKNNKLYVYRSADGELRDARTHKPIPTSLSAAFDWRGAFRSVLTAMAIYALYGYFMDSGSVTERKFSLDAKHVDANEAKTVLMVVPHRGFDPTEAAVPFAILKEHGHRLVIATPDGLVSEGGDALVVNGELLGGMVMKMASEAKGMYRDMLASAEWRDPIAYADIVAENFDGLLIPGGHAPGMKQMLTDETLRAKLAEFWALERPVGAICHGVLALSRAGLLRGRRTTTVPKYMERMAHLVTNYLTKHASEDYQLSTTWPRYTEDEVTEQIGGDEFFERGPLDIWAPMSLGTRHNHRRTHLVQDGNYLSARFPGDAYAFALRFATTLAGSE
eukprot:TRINITY_DN66392_c7_g1_i3.p1 TRINITY_DN66392_c7_g1~~TRINITY_DN66392_c7_g1_i3.p1  ORF type:complete len:612 (+),score=316.01 TRINITY_DN66392_c7_g1_i3:169-2004(+)